MTANSTPRTKLEEARDTVPADLLPHFDALVSQYRFRASLRHKGQWFSAMVLRDLVVIDGVRCPWVDGSGDDSAKAQAVQP